MALTKVAIIDPVGGHGGMDFYDYGLAKGLSENGAQVHIYTCNETNINSAPEGVEVIPCFEDLWKRNKVIRAFKFFRGYYRSYKKAKKLKVEAVHFHFFLIRVINLIALLIAKPFRFKKVLTIHDVDPLVNTAANILHTWIYKLVDEVIVHNEFSKAELLKKNIDPKKIHVIPHGNYLDSVETLPKKDPKEVFQLLFFGQIKDEKGLDILIEAMKLVVKRNPNIHLTIAGRPWRMNTDELEMKLKAPELKEIINTHFRYIPNEEVASFFEEADLIVLPYKRIYQSGVLLMTMSYGRPVLVSDLKPMKEIINNGDNGFTFVSQNEADLANTIQDIYNRRFELDGITKKALEDISERYSWINIAKKTIEVYTA